MPRHAELKSRGLLPQLENLAYDFEAINAYMG